MCVVSNTGDFWGERFRPLRPLLPYEQQHAYGWPTPERTDIKKIIFPAAHPTQEDFDRLREEVEIMKEQLKLAKEYDEKNGEPNCEIDAKMKLLREIAKLVGIDLDEVLNKKANV